MQRQLDGEVAQSKVGCWQVCSSVVNDKLLSINRVVGLQTEVSGMRETSVVAVVDVADDGGQ